MTVEETQVIAVEILDLAHPLATGPNTYRQSLVFASVLEGILRRDIMTLDTVLFLSQQGSDKLVVSGSPCMDLARAVLEDLVGVAYMLFKGKEQYANKFLAFHAVEAKSHIDLQKAAGLNVEKELAVALSTMMESEAKEFFKPDGSVRHRSWAKKSVEDMIVELKLAGKFQVWEETALLTTYMVGNQKNHLSPTSIQNYMRSDLFDQAGEKDMSMALAFIAISLVKMAMLFIDEIEDRAGVDKDKITKLWQYLIEMKPST